MKSETAKIKKGRMRAGILLFVISFVQAQGSQKEDLPIQLFPQPGGTNTLIAYVTGDGGWNSFSNELITNFGKQGASVIGLDAKKYFWTAKKPERFASDMEDLILLYLKKWKKSNCLIVGYSLGADVITFLPKHVSSSLTKKISGIALISPGYSTDFEVHIGDLISGNDPPDRTYKTKPFIQQSLLPTVCIFGKEENLLLKKELKETEMLHILELPGSHHYNNDTDAVVKQILARIPLRYDN